MSKKVTAIVLALSMLLCFTACGNKADSNESDTSQNGAVASSEGIPSGEPEPEPDLKTMPEYHFTEAVQERGVLTVGVSGNSKTCYVIPDDPEKYGELVGTRAGNVPEVCRRIAEELGVKVEFVEYATLEAQLQAVADGDVDLAADNFTITEERLALYEMTDDFNVREIEGDEVFLSTNPQPWLPPEEETEESSPETEDEAPVEPEPREMIQSEEDLAHARIATVKVYGAGYASTYFFGFASNFTGGKAVAARRVNESTDARMDTEDAPVIIDKSGNILTTISKEYYADESGFDPNMMVKIKPGGPFHGEDLYGLCDENGNVVVPCEYPYLQYCENGWYVAQNQDGRYGYIDKSGNVMIDFEFEDAEKFSCGLAPVLIDGLWGFINEDGEVVIEPAYLTASVATINADPYVGSCTFWDGVGKVQDGDQWILIDTQGNVVVDDPGFSGFYSCGNGLIAYQDAESGLWGYMTTDGKIAIEARFLSPDTFFPAD